jgi:uncharacterized cupredoxin-like copper-binding protein/ketosteroid isomerase-like protein
MQPNQSASVVAALFALLMMATPAHTEEVGNAIARAGAVDTQVTDELKLANEALQKAFIDRDIWAMGQLWEKADFVSSIFPAGAKASFGWDNVRRSWQQTFDHNRDIKIKSLAGLILPQGEEENDIALILDSNQFESFQTQTGQPVMMPNILATKIFQRRSDKWLLVHSHAHQPGLKPPTAGDEEVGTRPLVSTVAPELHAADLQFYQALRDRDLVAMDKVWSPGDAITAIQPEGNVPFIGRANVMKSWQQLFDFNKNVQIPRVTQGMVHVAGEKAWIVGSFEAGLTRQTGEFVHLAEVLTTKVFEKRGNEWFVIHYHGHIGPLAHTHGPGLPGFEGAGPIQSAQPTRTINIEASEMSFGVDKIRVRPGEIIQFVVTNKGQLRHEFSLGTPEEQENMRAMMRQMPDMIHNTDTVVSIEPGETKTLNFAVPKDATTEFSCNIPGHSEGGMRGMIEVEK